MMGPKPYVPSCYETLTRRHMIGYESLVRTRMVGYETLGVNAKMVEVWASVNSSKAESTGVHGSERARTHGWL